MKPFKPMLAGEADLSKLTYPLICSPKLDGLRGVIVDGKLLTRSLKPLPNVYTSTALSLAEFEGLDGELVVGPATAKDCYRQSSSGLMRQTGEPDFTFHVFDYWDKPEATYSQRLDMLVEKLVLARCRQHRLELHNFLTVDNEAELLAYESRLLDEGYEGVILRDPNSAYKFGRSSTKEGVLLKLKRFSDAEATIIGFDEQQFNGNEAVKNELGRTKRSTAAAGLSGKGTLGALVCRTFDGVEFRIGTGFDDKEKQHIWDHREDHLNMTCKFKHFEVGAKTAPRHPVYLGMRSALDMAA